MSLFTTLPRLRKQRVHLSATSCGSSKLYKIPSMATALSFCTLLTQGPTQANLITLQRRLQRLQRKQRFKLRSGVQYFPHVPLSGLLWCALVRTVHQLSERCTAAQELVCLQNCLRL